MKQAPTQHASAEAPTPGIDAEASIDDVARWALEALRDEFEVCPLVLLAEDRVKTAVAYGLLKRGLSVIESLPGPKGRGSELRLVGQSLEVTQADVPKYADGERPDLRISCPPIFIEFKASCSFGSNAAVTTDLIWKDVARVAEGDADLFVMAVDKRRYEALTALVPGDPGRPRRRSFYGIFPDWGPLGTGATFEWLPVDSLDVRVMWTRVNTWGHSAAFIAVAKCGEGDGCSNSKKEHVDGDS